MLRSSRCVLHPDISHFQVSKITWNSYDSEWRLAHWQAFGVVFSDMYTCFFFWSCNWFLLKWFVSLFNILLDDNLTWALWTFSKHNQTILVLRGCSSRRVFLQFCRTYYLVDGKEPNCFFQPSYSDWIHWHWDRRCNRKTFLFEESGTQSDDILLSTIRNMPVPFECSIVMQRLFRGSTWRVMGRNGFHGTSTETVTCSAACRRRIRVCKCPFFSIYMNLFCF